MDRKNETFHYHVRLQGGGGTLDWEMLSTRTAAQYFARQIVRPGETYVIEKFGEACMTCAAIPVKTARAGK
jgi:hypothetical protein